MEDTFFRELATAWYEPLYRFALSLAKKPEEASDLTQQTFYQLARKGHTLRDPSKAKSWLFTTLYREFIDQRRRRRTTSLEDLPAPAQEPVDLSVDDVEAMDYELVLDALQSLDESFRAPLTLFYLKDLSYREIAEILDLPVGTVMSRLSRAKKHLRTALAERLVDSKVVEFPHSSAS
jgi:RNA polymerase sigma-70 factor (ECF subfamily)